MKETARRSGCRLHSIALARQRERLTRRHAPAVAHVVKHLGVPGINGFHYPVKVRGQEHLPSVQNSACEAATATRSKTALQARLAQLRVPGRPAPPCRAVERVAWSHGHSAGRIGGEQAGQESGSTLALTWSRELTRPALTHLTLAVFASPCQSHAAPRKTARTTRGLQSRRLPEAPLAWSARGGEENRSRKALSRRSPPTALQLPHLPRAREQVASPAATVQ